MQALSDEGFEKDEILLARRIVQVRIHGQECSESIDWSPGQDLAAMFRSRYLNVYGYYPAEKPIEIVTLRVIAATEKIPLKKENFSYQGKAQSVRTIQSYVQSEWQQIPVFRRQDLAAGEFMKGPALVQDAFSTMCIDIGWKAIVGDMGYPAFGENLCESTRKGIRCAIHAIRIIHAEIFQSGEGIGLHA